MLVRGQKGERLKSTDHASPSAAVGPALCLLCGLPEVLLGFLWSVSSGSSAAREVWKDKGGEYLSTSCVVKSEVSLLLPLAVIDSLTSHVLCVFTALIYKIFRDHK